MFERALSKESEPGGPGFAFTPEGWRLPLNVEWNDGIAEKWNIGSKNRKISLILISDLPIVSKKISSF
jgi:hypothetical protein